MSFVSVVNFSSSVIVTLSIKSTINLDTKPISYRYYNITSGFDIKIDILFKSETVGIMNVSFISDLCLK